MSTDIAGDERWEFMSVTDSGCALVPALLFAGGATGAGALHAVPLLIPPRGTAGRVWWALLPSSVYLSAYLLYLATTRTTRAAASERTWRLEDRPGMLRLLVDRAVRAYAPVLCGAGLCFLLAGPVRRPLVPDTAAVGTPSGPPHLPDAPPVVVADTERRAWVTDVPDGVFASDGAPALEFVSAARHRVAHAATADRMSAETHLCGQPWWSRWTCLVVAAHIVWNVVRLAVGAAYLLSVPSREK
eukprot:ctg_573.g268